MKKLRKLLPKFLFKQLKKIQGLLRGFIFFIQKSMFLVKNTPVGANYTSDYKCSKIVGTYHVIEKGLTMPNPRLGFGQAKVLELLSLLASYIKEKDYNATVVEESMLVIKEYVNFNRKSNYTLNEKIIERLHSIEIVISKESFKPSTQLIFNSDLYHSKSECNFEQFSASRHSVRNLSSNVIDLEVIKAIVELANNAPSACNRQGTRVHYITNKQDIEKILRLQGGSRGFSDRGAGLFIITNESSVWYDIKSSYGSYIDGGIFSMNLLYAIHHHKIGACPLNCFFTPKIEKQIKSVAGIKYSENLVMMALVGYTPETFSVAKSKRILNIDNILSIK